MAQKTILIVEDDKNIAKLVKYNLEKAGYQCLTTITGEEALDIAHSRSVDLMILDIMLPKMDGLEVCRNIKTDEERNHIPVIMLTAKGEEVDRVVGFELGADDYVVKPFSPRELVLRVKALLKRQSEPEPEAEALSVPGLVVDIVRHKVTALDKKIELTPMEFKLLVTLMKRQGRGTVAGKAPGRRVGDGRGCHDAHDRHAREASASEIGQTRGYDRDRSRYWLSLQ